MVLIRAKFRPTSNFLSFNFILRAFSAALCICGDGGAAPDRKDVMTSDRPKTPAPFSLRLSDEERTELDRRAAGMSLGAYIRAALFPQEGAELKSISAPRGKFPVKDQKALARVLGLLGSSRLSSNINQLAKAANMGALPVTPKTEEKLQDACADIKMMREALMGALGLKRPGE